MIKRYEPMGPNRALLEHPRGRWVRHETFEIFDAFTRRLETELGEAKAEVERLRAENERLRVFHQAYTDRIRARAVTIADESFGPFPVLTADEALTEIEQGISKAHIERERLRAENERLRADRDARRADAIYGAALTSIMTPTEQTMRHAMDHAERVVELWRAAQKGGSDAGY